MAEEFSVQPLIDGWQRASEEIRRQIGERAFEAADRAAARVEAALPRRAGLLRGSVRTGAPRGWAVSAGAIVPARVVRVTAPHVHFVEDGTRQRFDATRRNANRGVMPRQGPIFIPLVIQEREAFLREAEALLEQTREVV